MAHYLILIFAFVSFPHYYAQDCLVHTGTYQGKNVYVQNPFASDGIGFSTKKVTVNGVPITNDIVSSAFEIDLKKLNLEIGDSVSIHIIHDEGALPKVINLDALLFKSNITFTKLWLENENQLHWRALGENQEFDYIIEQCCWNKWVKAGEVRGSSSSSDTCYSFELNNYSGINKVRVKYLMEDQNNQSKFAKSDNLIFTSKIEPVEFLKYDYIFETVLLSDTTKYELYNTFGVLVKKGFSKEINLNEFPKGLYYLLFDSFNAIPFEKF